MPIEQIITIALKSLWINKVRSFLTMLGVIIGVGSVVMLTSIGTGLQLYVTDQFADLGTNIVYVVPGNPFGENGGFAGQESFLESTKATLKRKYMDQVLRQNRDLIKDGAITNVGIAEAKFDTTTKKVTLTGVTANYGDLYSYPAQKGKWFTDQDDKQAERVLMLGAEVAEELFGQVDPVNKSIKLDGKKYRVLGVLEEKGGGFGGPSFDSYIYLPFQSLKDDFNVDLIDNITFEIRDKDKVDEATAAIEKTLLRELEEDDFSVFDQTQLLDTINSILGMLTIGLGGIAAISLIVGGIGIMNIMLVSVTERTREIGLRKALGATPNIILMQFLIEAALLSVTGGLIGVLIAYLGATAIQSVFPAQVTTGAVLLAFFVSLGVGLLFGAAPAQRASKLSPIEALRYE
jgi:putative ABC transport system permease protein